MHVRLGFLCWFILDTLANHFAIDMEKIYTFIKLNSDMVNASNIGYDLFEDAIKANDIKRSHRWIEVAYSLCLDKNVGNSPALAHTL